MSRFARHLAVNDRRMLLFGMFVAIAGIGFILFRSVIRPEPDVDIRFFWLAGKLWSLGIDPYSPAYERIGSEILPPGNATLYWFYPPQWWALCRMLAIADLSHAIMLWRLVSGLLFFVASGLLVALLAQGSTARRIGLIALASGFSVLIEPTANLLSIGQSTALIYVALVALVAGVLRENGGLVALALFLATFKPQIGAPLLVAMAMVPAYRWAAVAALGAAGLFALPQVIAFGPFTTLREFLDNLQEWSSLPSNVPLTSSGPMHLLARMGVPNLDLHYQLAAAFLVTAATGWLLRRMPDKPLPVLYLMMVALALLVPLHIYDFTIIVVPLVLQIATSRRLSWIAVLTVLATIRPGKVEMMLGIPQYFSISGGLLTLTGLSIVMAVDALRKVRQDWVVRLPRPAPRSALLLPCEEGGHHIVPHHADGDARQR